MADAAELSEIEAADWLNCERPQLLATLRGRVVVIEVFQMLCPGCVAHGLPQVQKLRQTFRPEDVMVLGLHSVFEHHEAMQPHALRAFVHEYGLRFPIAIDQPGTGPLPRTMEKWRLEGTPTLLLVDRRGRLRARHFGQVPDMALGAEVMALIRDEKGS